MHFENARTFEQWRSAARRLLSEEVSPSEVQWTDDAAQMNLFASSDAEQQLKSDAASFTVPNAFVEIAKIVACHRDPTRWVLLYRTLWRLLHGERSLLAITTDNDVYSLTQMQKSVTRDLHKMKAFVRFRKVLGANGVESYIAWHRPDHYIVRLAAPFFARRFSGMNWSILTPDQSVTWDQSTLNFGPGVPANAAPEGDALEELWKTYYSSIFNPARVKVATMKREMPVRHWATLPETQMIDELLREAPNRVAAMVKKQEGFSQTASSYMPATFDLSSLRAAAASCRACDLCEHATQTVFGEGPADARVVLVGEQPGDREDIEGHPFVGPAGRLLDESLAAAGIARESVYITNVVKHFKFVEEPTSRGKRRLHQKPDAREIFACRPWLEAELGVIRPAAVICLGATPAQALFGRDFRVTKSRGQLLPTEWCSRTVATWHPAAILRMPDKVRQSQMREELVADLTASIDV